MSAIREEIVRIALNRSYALVGSDIYYDAHKTFEFRKQTILADNFLTEDEKTEAIVILNETYDKSKVLYNSGTRRICENCNQEYSQNDYNNKETMQHHGYIDDDKEVHNNPNLHSGLTKNIKNLQIKNDPHYDYNNKATMERHACIDDDNEVYNNPNLHSDEQDGLEIPEDINFE
ncbi:hypothetical protein C1645_808253 [Glomus cerebriforme]|uniref:Uncharacterized protein n=1 Tax=Glomus cerebriforme TaxID=658196 RepID=A0A397SGT8_9GLOM|nr:hypothetical protein C1645_808253 [Glomus cerebriforme]